ncbi:unnamed protein product [Acanthoscelides obtectus]|uniref:HTH CENPB-type domain-containing protein n=1 Tax=Acanthoscelides obtectus TaxID=200917 RepID=A0A9P0PJ76_ACAOB|nr:unnamed protein product [Acanthoscelides obtectus]CAK1662954.1 Pogo transposable element with KRAB domain [Acanthoscelides obtectus]
MEQQLVQHIQEMDARFYGPTKQDLCSLTFEYNVPHNFRNGSAGEQWYSNFMRRHPELSLRTPQSTSIARACGFNRPQVQLFFDNLNNIRQKYVFDVDNIYNVHETGIQTSAKRPPKVISLKGKKQVGSISSAERGQLVSAICCCSATGKFIPPALVFPRKKRNPRYLNGTPPGTVDFVSDNGWITSEIFLEWMKFFVKSVRPSPEHKCLLILDNHISHRSLEVLDYASANNVVILSVPPHATNKLQPLDVAVYGPIGTYFEREVDKWQKQHPAQHITFYELGAILGSAYLQGATPQNEISGFKKTGILDGNIDVFSDLDFVPSQVTEKEYDANKAQNLAASNGQSASPSSPIPSCSRHEVAEDTQRNVEHRTPPHSPISLCSLENENHGKENRSSSIPSCSFQSTYENSNYFIPLTAIQPLPQKSEILTSTPIREELRNKKNKKLPKTKLPDEMKRAKKPSSSNLDQPKLQYPQPPVHKTDPNEENVPCLVCGDTFGNSRPGETWIECNMCQNWAHQLWADYNRGVYICDKCKLSVLSSLK